VGEEVGGDGSGKRTEGAVLESSFGEFAKQTPELFEAVIAERDCYMAAKLRQLAVPGGPREVLAVVGAGHLKGLAGHLRDDTQSPAEMLVELNALPHKSDIPWLSIFLALFLVGGFAWGIHKGGLEVGGELILRWVLITGAGGAIGCLAAGGHPLSIIAAFVASPLTPLHPALSSGMVSAGVEAWVRKPTYADFLALRNDTGSPSGWWRNRVARVFVNFMLTNLGTAIAVWVAGAAVIHKLG